VSRARLLELIRTRAWRKGPVKLASGAISDFYIDCRQVALYPDGMVALGEQLLDALEQIEAETGRQAQAVGGMALGAVPLAVAVCMTAHRRGRALPAFIVRKTAKDHGTGAFVEGVDDLAPGAAVLLVEDVVTSGGSTHTATDRVRAAGLDPFGCACIVDRQAGGVERLRGAGLTMRALFTRAEVEAV
jgi:orotate phosphoribosyltransferase